MITCDTSHSLGGLYGFLFVPLAVGKINLIIMIIMSIMIIVTMIIMIMIIMSIVMSIMIIVTMMMMIRVGATKPGRARPAGGSAESSI